MPFQLFRPFQRLQWKLTLSYVLVTVVAVLTLEIAVAVFLAYFVMLSDGFPKYVAGELTHRTSQIAPDLAASPPKTAALTDWAGRLKKEAESDDSDHGKGNGADIVLMTSPYQSGEVIIVDTAGRVAASTPGAKAPARSVLMNTLQPHEAAVLRAALLGRSDLAQLGRRESAGAGAAAAPVFLKDGRLAGAVLVRYVTPLQMASFLPMLTNILIPTAIIVAIVAGIAGLGFGFLNARSLTRRLDAISNAADAWRHGDFNAEAVDRSGDELGLLARRLNTMAQDLHSLVSLRQNLATMEERTRLARDLHDTVKQQVFAASMQIGAASSLMDQDPAAAKDSLKEAAVLVRQVHQELASILQELAPGPDIQTAGTKTLREYLGNWSRQSGIAIVTAIDDELILPRNVEQAFLRICQEALANIARHSCASEARVRLTMNEDSVVVLYIADNGKGFSSQTSDRRGNGLSNMRTRAEELPSGSFSIRSQPEEGVAIAIHCRPGDQE